ncbi:MAG: hypothetical protein EAZ27_08110 [Cytophagales bacterium]|nr:MAG: hypothetical protein EAZ27_08110 [Cytophagales bacterium]
MGDLKKDFQLINSGNVSPTIDNIDFPDVFEDFETALVAGLAWIGATILLIFLLFFFETILWGGIIILTAAMYWIFYRATKFVVRKNANCKRNLIKSLSKSFLYTFLYSSWIYGCVFVAYYFKN